MRAAPILATAFWDAVSVGDQDECWPWTRARHPITGHGRLRVDGVVVGAHRIAYERAHGPIPNGLFVCHHCDNPPCCNPAHLYAGTALDNARDAIERGRRPTARPKPPPLVHMASGPHRTMCGKPLADVRRWVPESEAVAECKSCEKGHERRRGRKAVA